MQFNTTQGLLVLVTLFTRTTELVTHTVQDRSCAIKQTITFHIFFYIKGHVLFLK